MQLRRFILWVMCIPGSIGLLQSEPSSTADASQKSSQLEEGASAPNVVMICIDDLNDWVGFMGGHPEAKTPNMDVLAARGRIFENAHCAVPVCSPSRISVMSGVAATTHGSYELGPRYEDLPALKEVPTIQGYFKRNGYTTMSGGKVLHHGFKGHLSADIDRHLGQAGGPRPKTLMNSPSDWSRAWDWGPFPESNADMHDFRLAEKAAEILKNDFEDPFFMSVGFFRPHVPLFVPPEWFDLYDEVSLSLPSSPASDLDDVPVNFQGINHYAAAPTHDQVVGGGKQRSLTRAYLASISFVDHCVGIVLNALTSGPHANNTVVVLWSDHGFHLGEKQHWAKRTLWEESTKVPLLFAGPGITPAEACEEAVSLLDIYPTLVDVCQLPKPPHLEGQSLIPQLQDSSAQRLTPAITSSYFGNHSVRSKNWRLIVYRNGARELYHHSSDAHEFHNLASDPKHQAILDQLTTWLPKNPVAEFKNKSERIHARF